MYRIGDFKGCKAIVRDPESLAELLETVVLEHNRERAIVTVADEKRRLRLYDKVSVIILGAGMAYEYHASTRQVFNSADRVELALYNLKTTPIRAEKRYDLNGEALVESFIEIKSDMHRKLPLKVYVVNISATGALIEPVHVRFEVGEVFALRLQMGGSEVVAATKVLREDADLHGNFRYGCKFLSIK